MTELVTDTTRPVLVTGATGYVAGWLVKRLLDEGFTVHATVRNIADKERIAYLRTMGEASPGAIRFFRSDLTRPGSFDEPMAGCRVVFHVASPYTLTTRDPQEELVEPAVAGTTNVLAAVERTSSVRRVVLTSSMAAIYGENADLPSTPRGTFDEEVWNTTSTLDNGAYALSKTLAEREAWSVHDQQDRWRLVAVHPPFVFGPGVRVHESAASFQILRQFGDGTFARGVPDLRGGVVDVRDVAEGHLRAAFLPDASGRYVLSAYDSGFLEWARILREHFPNHPIPRRRVPKWLLWLVGPIVSPGLTRRFVSRSVGLPFRADHGKAVRELQMTFRPLEQTLTEHFRQLIDAGLLKAT